MDAPVTWAQVGQLTLLALAFAATLSVWFRVRFRRWPWS